MSEWRNLKAIENDLFCAQGRTSIDIGQAVGCDDRPPLPEYDEETEEEFYKYCTGDGDFSAAPELEIIKDMLSLVKASDVPIEDDERKENLIVFKSNLNPQIHEFIPKSAIVKKKRSRNAAMASLLQAIGEPKPDPIVPKQAEKYKIANSVHPNSGGRTTNGVRKDINFKIKVNQDGNREIIASDIDNDKSKDKVCSDPTNTNLCKPVDRVTIETVDVNGRNSESISKVNTWLNSQHKKSIEINPSSMFKRKSTGVKYTSKSSLSPSSESKCDNSYKPSDLANEYYQKYMERSKLKEQVELDIWRRAEKQMKEIDTKRKLEAEQLASSPPEKSSSTPSTSTAPQDIDNDDVLGTHAYKLPFNRHIWTDDCLICETMEKHNYDVKRLKEQPQLLDAPAFMAEEHDSS